MMTSRSHMVARFAALSAAILLITACPRPLKPPDIFAPVPEGEARLEYDLTKDSSRDPADPESTDVIARAVEGTVCLLRSGSDYALECTEVDPNPPVCAVGRGREELRAAVEPTLSVIPTLRLTSPALINREVRALLPDTIMIVTTAVIDARRTSPCRDWRNPDGACVAVKVDKAWILLHAPPAGGPVDTLWVFLAENVCEERPNP